MPSASEMAEVSAVSVSPTSGVPLTVGAPAGGLFGLGCTVNSIGLYSRRPSAAQTASGSSQSKPASISTVIGTLASGVTETAHIRLLLPTASTPETVPPETARTWSRSVSVVVATVSLKWMRNDTSSSWRCSLGKPLTWAVTGALWAVPELVVGVQDQPHRDGVVAETGPAPARATSTSLPTAAMVGTPLWLPR